MLVLTLHRTSWFLVDKLTFGGVVKNPLPGHGLHMAGRDLIKESPDQAPD